MLQPLGVIAACSKNRCIGKNNELPWHFPEDMKRFRKITLRHTVIMGRKTFESIGKPLAKRRNMIITRDRNFTAQGCEIYHSLEEAMKASKIGEYCHKIPIVIGGAQIYEMAVPIATRMWLTIINKYYDGDTFFPRYVYDEWGLVTREAFDGFEFKTLFRQNTYLDLR